MNAASAKTFHRIPLGGGATLLAKRRSALPSVAVAAFVRGGTAYETEESNGVNAFTHRAMIKGTTSRTSGEIARESELFGATIVPAYGADFSGISFQTLARFLDPAFEVFADLLAHPAFPAAVVESERSLLLADIVQEEDEPFQKTSREFQRALFGADPYGLPGIGTAGSVRNLRREQLIAWHERFYRAENLLFVVVGDFDEASVVARARALLEALSDAHPRGASRGRIADSAPAPPPAVTFESLASPREVVLERDVNQDVLLIGFPGPAARHEDAYPLQVLSAVMSGMGNRLFVALRDREGLCYYTGMYYRPLARAGVIGAYIGTSPEKEDRARAALDREFARLLDDGVGADEVVRAQNALIGHAAIGRQTNGAEASLAARYELLGLGFEEADRYEERVLAVTPDQILGAARRWLRPDRRVLAVTRPKRGPG